MVTDTDLKESTYTSFFNKKMDNQNKKIVEAYHPHKDDILHSQIDSSGIINILLIMKKSIKV